MINPEDLETVRERSRIEDVVGGHVTLRRGGGGSLTGLCPFHEEKTASFHVTPARGYYHCFGCGEGGDVFDFVQKINNISFSEAVELLADRCGVQLRYSNADGQRSEPGLRLRVLEANKAAAEYFTEQLVGSAGLPGRQFLDGRGFDKDAAAHFGIGYAPQGGHDLRDHLRARGFRDEELVKAGLIREQGWDFFQGRVLWPIRDAGASVLGFGARRIFDDDRMPAKYINTPETVVYKKSQVLYGLDLARANIAKKNQVVIVEGYTDVMACHLSGVDTAVASCGTAFGEGHSRMLHRLLGTGEVSAGEVIFTFDGDAAGQAAAMKVFKDDHIFAAQTYVAVARNGMDPCDLRMADGDAAVRDLVARREPLYRFVMRNVVERYDLDRADGRLAAVRAAAPLVSSVRDKSLVREYIGDIAKLVGMELDDVRAEVRTAQRSQPRQQRPPQAEGRSAVEGDAPPARSGLPVPPPNDRGLEAERATLRLLLHAPKLFGDDLNHLTVAEFTHPTYQALFAAIAAAPDGPEEWSVRLMQSITDPVLEQLVITMMVEPELREPTEAYAAEYASVLRLRLLARKIADLRSKMQRMDPQKEPAAHGKLFAQLVALEADRKALLAVATGAGA
jgi:DNA primase